MTKKHLKDFISVIALLIFSINGKAQVPSQRVIPLVDFLLELEATYQVKFSYADTDVSAINIEKPDAATLKNILEYIGLQTDLTISKLNDRYYTLSNSANLTICGYVLDNFKNNTIPGATVEILDTKKAIVTDEAGMFSFENVPKNTLVLIKYLGFKPLFLPARELVSNDTCKSIAMALSYQELDEVIVSKFLTTGLSKLPDASIELSPANFGILPGISEPDVLQAIQALPGIKSVDETVSDINIRGGTNDQNLVLWDGIKMYQTGHFFGLISAFNPYVTNKIKVVKNGTSAIFGGGLSGTLDMKTLNTVPLDFSGGAGFNLISGDVHAQIPLQNNIAVQVSARRSLTDFINTPTYTVFSEKAFQDSEVNSENAFYFYDFTTKLLYDINTDQKLRLSMITMSNNLNYLEVTQNNGNPNQSDLKQQNISLGAQLLSNWTDDFTTDLHVYYTQYELEALTISNSGQQQLQQNNLVKESSLKFTTSYFLGANLQWANGYELTETGIENRTNINQPPFASNIKGVLRKHALFSELSYRSENKKLVGMLGGRLNYVQNLDNFKAFILEPRINLTYALAPNFKTELLGEFKSQATNQIIDLEQNFLGIERRRWILSDGDALPITKSRQVSLGFNYDTNRLYLGIDAFYKTVDGINVDTQGFQNRNQFDGEIGSYAVKGMEFLVNTKNNNYSAWVSYTYNKNDYTFDALTPQTFPNNLDVRHSATLAATYNVGKLKIGGGLTYKSGKPYTRPTENNPINTTVVPNQINYEIPNSSRLPEYIRADVSATYRFKLGESSSAIWGASLLNLTNRKNTLNTYYRLLPNNRIETIERISLGMTPNASFRIQF